MSCGSIENKSLEEEITTLCTDYTEAPEELQSLLGQSGSQYRRCGMVLALQTVEVGDLFDDIGLLTVA